jgi:thiol-disulfide isomerase/thioredoxin
LGKLKAAPDFQVVAYQGEELLGGKEVKFSQLFSQRKPVVLNFWAGLCPPCRAEMPDLQQVSQEYQDRVLLFGLDVGPFVGLGSREDGKALLKELQVTYPAGTTFDAEVVRKYQILGMPTTVFIKPDGKVLRTWTGLLTRKKLSELVEELLAAPIPSGR